jgi:tight adherence protein C
MHIPDFLLVVGVLLGGLSVYIAVSTLLNSIFSNQNQMLVWATGDAPKKSKSGVIRLCRPLVHRLVLPLVARYKFTDYKERVKREVQSAGLGDELNADEYLGLQILLGIMLPLFMLMLKSLFGAQYPLALVAFMGGFGAMYPYLYVKGYKDIRRNQVRVDLPFVVDLLALSTEAGADFIGAIQKVTDKMKTGALAEELAQVLKDLKLGSSRAEALNAMSYRLNMPEVTSFIAVLTTADSLGASIGNVLRQQSEQLRQERFVRAEKAGAEASQKVFVPIIMFILPAVLIMVVGPVILNFIGAKP